MIKGIKKLAKKKSTGTSAKKKTVTKETKTKKTVLKSKSGAKKISPSEFFLMVEKKAYDLYIKRGYSHGDDQSDWYQAEKILKSKLSK